MLDPFNHPVDYVLITDQRSPGLSELVNLERERRIDARLAPGSEGASLVYFGTKPVEFEVHTRLFSPEDYSGYFDWIAKIGTLPKNKSGGYDFWHPIAQELGVKSVVIRSQVAPVQTDDGVWLCVLKLLERRDAVRPPVKIDGSKATAVDPVDKYLEELTKQVQQLAAQ